jgi:protein TonB
MFDAFELDQSPEHTRRLTGATVAALIVMGMGLALAVTLANAPVRKEVEKKVDVSFRPPPPPPEPAKIENAPPPKPKPPPPPVAEAPVLNPGAAAMVAPTEVPKAAAPESDTAVAAIHVAVGGTGDGSNPGVAAAPDHDESAAPVVASAGSRGPVNLPEDADPPEPDENNPQPEYPESARASGQEARVVLKIVVEADGRVGRIQVLKGEEPFTSAALAAVRAWKYEPARLDGQPIVVFKIVDLKFRLRE